MVPVLAINAVPLVLVGLAWWIRRNESASMPPWRRRVFFAALIANTVSSFSLPNFLLGTWSGTMSAEFSGVVLLSMLAIGPISAVLAFFGRRVSRLLLIANGLLVAVFWNMAGMAMSV